uniref:RBBP6 ligase n=1 Tax=Salarias fasciatus TaxID=181472 RepID=A0A672FU25_SALFA
YICIQQVDDQNSTLSLFSKMTNLADVDVPEEDKLKVMMSQSVCDSMNLTKKPGNLPESYTCYRCGLSGHHIRNCPTIGVNIHDTPVKIKKSTGIPRSFMVEVDDPGMKGAMLTSCGRYAIPVIDAEAYAIGKKEKPLFSVQESESEEDPIPDELLCLICRDLLCDSVVIPCCGNSYCDDCIRTALLDSEDHVCPTCGQSDVSPDTLIANKFLRQVNTGRQKFWAQISPMFCFLCCYLIVFVVLSLYGLTKLNNNFLFVRQRFNVSSCVYTLLFVYIWPVK